MSAIAHIEVSDDGTSEALMYDPHDEYELLFCEGVGSIHFLFEVLGAERSKWTNKIAFDGMIAESLIPSYLGKHPDGLIEGFTESDKPEGFAWMGASRIKTIVNHRGSVMVELEPTHRAAV